MSFLSAVKGLQKTDFSYNSKNYILLLLFSNIEKTATYVCTIKTLILLALKIARNMKMLVLC